MADFVTRSQQEIHDWSNVYGPGYAPEYFGGTSRFTITRTAITKMAGSALLGECTFTITFKSNNTEDPSSQRNSGYNYAIDYEVYIGGARRGTARLVSRTQYINKNTTYVRTLKATNIPLGTATTVPAYIRTVNDRPSSQALLFDSRNQGGDSLSGLPLGIQTANFASFSNFTIVNAATRISASVTARSSGVTHNVRLKHGTTTVMSWSGLGNFTTLEVTQTQAQTLLNRLSTVTSASVKLEVDTVYSGSVIYTQSRTATATVGIGPSIGAVNVTDSSTALATVGALVQGVSNISLEIRSQTAGYGATIRTYGFEWLGQSHSGKTSSTLNTGIINRSGSQTFTGRMSNSRGQVASRSTTVTVLPWSAPRSTSVQVRRCTSTGTIDPAGSYIRVTGTHSVSPLKVGTTNKNTMRVLVRYRVAGTTTWTTPLNKTYPAGTVSTSEAHTLGGGALDPTKTYEFEVISYDRYASTVVTGLIPTERVLISKKRNDGVGFGKIHERGIIDAKGDVYIDGELDVTGAVKMNGKTVINEDGMLQVKDTRAVQTPTNNGIGHDIEFKQNSTLGISGLDTYAVAHTFQGWKDDSGGNIHQIAFTSSSRLSEEGRIFYRSAPVGAARWGSWTELMTAKNAVRSYTDTNTSLTWQDHLAQVLPKLQDRTPYQLVLFSSGGQRSFTGSRNSTAYGSFIMHGYPNGGESAHAILSNGNWIYKSL